MLMAPPPRYSPIAINHQNNSTFSTPGMQGQSVLRPGAQSAIHGMPQLGNMAGGNPFGNMTGGNPLGQATGMSGGTMQQNPMAPNPMAQALGAR